MNRIEQRSARLNRIHEIKPPEPGSCPCCGQRITAELVIEQYYRSRAAGGRKTLKQLAQQYGFNASYLSRVKSVYDNAGKWGSKISDQ